MLYEVITHDGEAHTMFAGSRGLDGGIERQQVGLVGDFADDAGDARNLRRLVAP